MLRLTLNSAELDWRWFAHVFSNEHSLPDRVTQIADLKVQNSEKSEGNKVMGYLGDTITLIREDISDYDMIPS